MAQPNVCINRMSDSFLAVRDSLITEAGDGFCTLTGYAREEVLHIPFLDFIHSRLRLVRPLQPHPSGVEQETLIYTRSLEPIEVTILGRHGDGGAIYYYFKENPNSRLDAVFPLVNALYRRSANPVAIYSTEPDTLLLTANQAFLDFLDPPYNAPDQAFGKPIHQVMAGWKGSAPELMWDKAIKNGEAIVTDTYARSCLKQGIRYYESTLTPIRVHSRVKYVVELTKDVTGEVEKKKQIEEQTAIIRDQKQKLEAIIRHMTDGLMVFDAEGRLMLKNPAAERHFLHEGGVAVKEGDADGVFYDVDGCVLAGEQLPPRRVLRGESFSGEEITMKEHGGMRYLSISGTPVFDENGKLQYGMLLSHDMTKHILGEKALLESQKRLLAVQNLEKEALRECIRMKDDFVSFITHEFKTPLAVINSALQAIEYLCGHEISDRTRGFLNKIRQNTFRQLRLVNNMLDITRFYAGKSRIAKRNLDVVFLTKSIVESVRLYAQNKNVLLDFSATLARKVIGIDDEKYERILLNLLSNAIKFTPVGKSVHVRLGYRSKTRRVQIDVVDEGVGIPLEKQQLIFERFGQVESSLTRQAEGTGIGLSLVKMLVQEMGGEIALSSEINKGSTFSVFIPAERVQEPKAAGMPPFSTDSRLIQATAIEFSDIYY